MDKADALEYLEQFDLREGERMGDVARFIQYQSAEIERLVAELAVAKALVPCPYICGDEGQYSFPSGSPHETCIACGHDRASHGAAPGEGNGT